MSIAKCQFIKFWPNERCGKPATKQLKTVLEDSVAYGYWSFCDGHAHFCHTRGYVPYRGRRHWIRSVDPIPHFFIRPQKTR